MGVLVFALQFMADTRQRVTCRCPKCVLVVTRAHADHPHVPIERFRPPFCGHIAPLVWDYWGLGPAIVVGTELVNGTMACNVIGGKMEESCAWAAMRRECWEETGWIVPMDANVRCVAMSGATAVFVVDFGNLSKDAVMRPREVSVPELASVEYLRLSDMRVMRRMGREIRLVDLPVSGFVAAVCADVCRQLGLQHIGSAHVV